MTIKKYLLRSYTADTAKIYLYEIENYIANYPEATQAVYKDVVSYMGTLRSKYSNASTLNRILCSIRAYYDFLCYTGRRTDNPAKAIKLRDQRSHDIQLQDLFTAEELEALLDRPERYNNLAHRNRVLISLLIYQALLPGEKVCSCCGLRYKNPRQAASAQGHRYSTCHGFYGRFAALHSAAAWPWPGIKPG